MNNFIKENWFKMILIFVFLFIIGEYFYWYQWRPVQIKKECSWTKVINPAQSEITEEEVKKSQEEYDSCLEKSKQRIGQSMFDFSSFCGPVKQKRDYIAEKTYYRQATKEEYEFCLHSKGI